MATLGSRSRPRLSPSACSETKKNRHVRPEAQDVVQQHTLPVEAIRPRVAGLDIQIYRQQYAIEQHAEEPELGQVVRRVLDTS